VDGVAELTHRVGLLDAMDGSGLSSDVTHFIMVMSQVTTTGDPDISGMPRASPADADRVMAQCQLLTRLRRLAPHIVIGPLARDSQYWIQDDTSNLTAATSLAEEHLEVVANLSQRPSAKPFGVGLFTSSGLVGSQGMWRTYLDLYEGDRIPSPVWRVWTMDIDPSARVLDITSACDWAKFIARYTAHAGGLLYPDWVAASKSYDAVHITVGAIAAAQGMLLTVRTTTIAPMYWDVESTLWLRWCFSNAHIVEVVARNRGRHAHLA
jgi:hypothetical protein